MKEANIVINGKLISSGKALTIRVALNGFIHTLMSTGLGDDTHGKNMVDMYTENSAELLELIADTNA